MSEQQKHIAIIVGSGAALLLLIRWYASRSAGSGTAAQPADQAAQTGAPEYAQLAGQEQADAAALSNQEGSDVAGISSTLSTLTGQEQTDVGALSGQYTGLSDQVDSLTGYVHDALPNAATMTALSGQINALQAGEAAQTRQISLLQKALGGKGSKDHRQRGKPPRLAPGARRLPFGGTKPKAPKGYTVKGQGGGYWEAIPNHPKGHGSTAKAATAAVAPVSHATKPAVAARPATVIRTPPAASQSVRRNASDIRRPAAPPKAARPVAPTRSRRR